MTPEQWPRVKEIVGAALECEAGSLDAFLDDACAGEPHLRAEVDSLIAAYQNADSLAPAAWGAAFGDSLETPRSIGPYRLERELGAGGMGQVWLAEQTEPVRRRVAIKLIRAGLLDGQVVQRFLSERQSLALMNHPAIAKVFDAGTTPSGQPYLVMEYVDGCPITEYCDLHGLPIAARLELFQRVCEGVQHAHQKAIIHRDLKPSNILVTEIDGKAVPRIIDFGVARGIARDPTAGTHFTQVGAMIGTLGYMSPEQSDLNGDDIDTRTDVYSLGVVLYELLVGALPFDRKQIDPFEFRQHLRNAEVQRPSSRLRTLGQGTPVAARSRSTDIVPLLKALRGDLDAIALKALEKDRRRRYATPSELATDIGNYLRNEPVSARAPSMGYRAGKYIRRHRLAAIAAGSGLALLVGFAVAQTISLRNVRLQRDRADRITGFMTNIFKVSDPSEARGSSVTAREILDKSSKEIEAGTGLDASVQSQLMAVMAETYLGLGLYSRAHDLAERALDNRRRELGTGDPKTFESMRLLGSILYAEGHDVDAEALLRKAIELQAGALGPGHGSTIETKHALAVLLVRHAHNADAVKLERDIIAVETRTHGPESMQTLRSLNTLASALRGESHFGEAEQIFRQLLEVERRSLGSDHPMVLKTMHDLANVLSEQGRYDEAEGLYRETLATQRRILGAEHPETASTLTTLANAVRLQAGRKPEAEALYRSALATQLHVAGPENSFTTRAQEGLANVLNDEKHYTEAEGIFRDVLKMRQRILGPDNTDVLLTQYNLGDVLVKEKRFAEAEGLLRKTLDQQTRVLDTDDPDTLASKALLAETLRAEDRPREAAVFARQAYDAQVRVLGLQHHDTQDSLAELSRSMSLLGRYDEAKALYLQTLAGMGKQPNETAAYAWYRFACTAANAGHADDAFDALDHAIKLGYASAESLQDDDELEPLHRDPRFAQAIESSRTRAYTAKQSP